MKIQRTMRSGLTLSALALTIFIISRRFSWNEVQEQLQALEPLIIVALLIMTAATRIPQAEALRAVLVARNERVNFMDSFWAVSVKTFFNQAFSGAGLMAQALRMKLSHAVAFPVFIAATWIQLIAQVFAVALTGFITGMVFAFSRDISPMLTAFPWLGLLGAGLLLTYLPEGVGRLPLIGARLASITAAAPKQAHPGQLLYVIALYLAVLAFRASRLGLVVAFIAPEISVAGFLFAFMVGELALIAPITPGGIGIRELLLGVGAIGTGAETLILAGLVDRAAAIIVTLAIGSFVLLRPTRSTSG